MKGVLSQDNKIISLFFIMKSLFVKSDAGVIFMLR